MNDKKNKIKYIVISLIIFVAITIILLFVYRSYISGNFYKYYNFIINKQQFALYIESFGIFAPIVFLGIQILQVIFAPIPGEVTGFIGGYLFGALHGFIYSTIGLSIGSCINFFIGRLLGKKFIRKLIPEKVLEKFDSFVTNKGIFILLILFIFPGFPKDYLCLFLGLSTLSFKPFFFIATIGRMPGTLLLSFQGASLFKGNYVVFAILFAICVIMAIIAYVYQKHVYKIMDKKNKL